MNCREFWSSLPEMRVHAGGPPAPPGPEHARHLAACPACAESFERQLALTADLDAVAAEFRRVAAPARVEARLLAEFRRQAGTGPLPKRPVRRVPFFGWAAAAVVLLTAAVLLTEGRQPAPPQHTLPATTELASIEAPEMADAGEAGSADGDFLPLPNAEQVAPGEDMDLVRVEVPRSAMIAAGFAVSASRAAERVEADVLLGPDGLARAVRFVN